MRRPKRLSLQSRALQIAWLLSSCAAIVCAAILLVGYGAGYERLYQPWPNGPSTHPFTALALGLLALGTLLNRPFKRSWLSTGAFFIALAIGLVRMADIVGGWHVLDNISPFSDVLARHRLSGSPITFGWNTALAVVVAAIAGLSQTIRRPTLSQVLAIVALAPPMVSVVGYSYGLRDFYGAMSIYTTLILIAICVAIVLSTAHQAFVSVALNNYTAGRLARHLLLAVVAIPFAGGILVVRMSDFDNDIPVALLVVCVALGNMAVTFRAMLEIERLDKARRRHERISDFEATHDALTALANRRSFVLAATHEFARAQRFGSKLSLCMIDIDHFKEVNDQYGHQVGDQVLACVGRILPNSCRNVDVVGRYGGEEFVALLPETGLDGAFHWAETLRSAIKLETFHDAAGNSFSVTISVGVTEKTATDDKFEELIGRADEALYAAKAAGRNRTCTAPRTVGPLLLSSSEYPLVGRSRGQMDKAFGPAHS